MPKRKATVQLKSEPSAASAAAADADADADGAESKQPNPRDGSTASSPDTAAAAAAAPPATAASKQKEEGAPTDADRTLLVITKASQLPILCWVRSTAIPTRFRDERFLLNYPARIANVRRRDLTRSTLTAFIRDQAVAVGAGRFTGHYETICISGD